MAIRDDMNRTSGLIVDAAMAVHSALGPGLLESAYQATLAHALRRRGCVVAEQVPIPVSFEGVQLEAGYYADMIVDGRVIVELKATAKLAPVHTAQLLSYIRLSGLPLGLLINFHEPRLKHGIKRLIAAR